jgi:hypothetical protein
MPPETPNHRKHTEEDSQAELNSTEIQPGVARAFCWCFVLLLIVLPVSQFSFELFRGQRPTVFQILEAPLTGRWSELTDRKYLSDYESALEKSSAVRAWVQANLQERMTRWLGVGNHKVMIGQNGWLFYQAGVDYAAGADFLGREALAARMKGLKDRQVEADPHPDPRPALVAFISALRAHGVTVLLVPVPDKVMIHPERLTARASGVLANNPGYPQFVATVERAGGVVFDATGLSRAKASIGRTLYLGQDTHWRPEWMAEMASAVGETVRERFPLPVLPKPLVTVTRTETRRRVGDLVDMLALPKGQSLYVPEEVAVTQIIDQATNRPLAPDPESDVVLLGDSFTNIYSDPGLGWGEGAGFAAHLGRALGRRLQVVAYNGAAATGARQEFLRTEQARRLYSKKLLVYEFTMHDLTTANWRPLPLPRQEPPPVREPIVTEVVKPTPAVPAGPSVAGGVLQMTAEIELVSPIPTPGVSAYRDCLAFARVKVLKVVSGEYRQDIAIVAFHVMKDNQLTESATLRVGDRVRLDLQPLKEAPEIYRGMQRSDTTDDFEHVPQFVAQFAKVP